MKNAEKIKNFMEIGRVYRRQDLAGVSTAVDRDLKTLVDSGEVRKLGCGLYGRSKKNTLGAESSDHQQLVRAFLKTDDFLLTSYDYFTQLGVGLARRYDQKIVYNHKRSGDFTLGGQRFQFRVIRAYPKTLSKEYLLLDLLNHIKVFRGEGGRVLKNLKSHLGEFDLKKLASCLERYGNRQAIKILRGMLDAARPSAGSGGASVVRDNVSLRIVAKQGDHDDLLFWSGKSPAERIAAMEVLRQQYYAMSGYKSLPRLAHVIQVRDRQT